jgi:acyl-coenzyme A synthetase/AMP-(fatty) acid ligase
MPYTQDGIMAQIYVAFGQGAGVFQVSQDAALELHRWYYDAITPDIVNTVWATESGPILIRIRAIGSLAALTSVLGGLTTITARIVYDAATTVQLTSDTNFCPPPPSQLK